MNKLQNLEKGTKAWVVVVLNLYIDIADTSYMRKFLVYLSEENNEPAVVHSKIIFGIYSSFKCRYW